LSERTFRIINGRVSGIATVSEDEIVAAMRFVWTHMKQLIEPSAAVPFAVVLRGDLAGRRVGLIASGGNVDLDSLPW
jgi:threonine dehydratase